LAGEIFTIEVKCLACGHLNELNSDHRADSVLLYCSACKTPIGKVGELLAQQQKKSS
jgi:hypothetical protein